MAKENLEAKIKHQIEELDKKRKSELKQCTFKPCISETARLLKKEKDMYEANLEWQ